MQSTVCFQCENIFRVSYLKQVQIHSQHESLGKETKKNKHLICVVFLASSHCRIISKVKCSWRPTACHVFNTSSLPSLVNLVDGDLRYCWSKHFSRTFISFPLTFIVLLIELYESNISVRLLGRSLGKMRFWH